VESWTKVRAVGPVAKPTWAGGGRSRMIGREMCFRGPLNGAGLRRRPPEGQVCLRPGGRVAAPRKYKLHHGKRRRVTASLIAAQKPSAHMNCSIAPRVEADSASGGTFLIVREGLDGHPRPGSTKFRAIFFSRNRPAIFWRGGGLSFFKKLVRRARISGRRTVRSGRRRAARSNNRMTEKGKNAALFPGAGWRRWEGAISEVVGPGPGFR